MHKTRKEEVNNSLESDHSPTMPHGPSLKLMHRIKEFKVFMKTKWRIK